MLFRVEPDNPVGLSDQIASQVRGALAEGRLSPGDKLPAARALAASLDVNMHTVLRAYSTLRDEGLIELRRGRGAQVRSDLDSQLTALDNQIRALVGAARNLGMSPDQLLGHIKQVTS